MFRRTKAAAKRRRSEGVVSRALLENGEPIGEEAGRAVEESWRIKDEERRLFKKRLTDEERRDALSEELEAKRERESYPEFEG